MSANIILAPDEVWGYFFDNIEVLKNSMHMIAENKEYGIEVYVTERNDLPELNVTADDRDICSESVVNELDCTKTVCEIYDLYLTDRVVNTLDDEVDERDYSDYGDELEDADFNIQDRENELSLAFEDFFSTAVWQSDIDVTDDREAIERDCLEHILEYLARKHNVAIYRPMWIDYGDGDIEYEEYPYDSLEFPDEDNPIYAQ